MIHNIHMQLVAAISDIHAGLGRNDISLRLSQTQAVAQTMSFLNDRKIHALLLNGDTTDHVGNALSCGTDSAIAWQVLEPLRTFIDSHRDEMQTVLLAGNTDGVIADSSELQRQVFFDYTGLQQEDVCVPEGGLRHSIEGDRVSLHATHGHAMLPKQWGYHGEMTPAAYATMWAWLKHPEEDGFLESINATGGAHRRNYLLANALGIVTKPLPFAVRESVSRILGMRMTQGHEQHFANTLSLIPKHNRKIVGLMGHTHVAGVRSYDDITIINTGTAGAKPNPLQRVSDPVAHAALIDTDDGTYELVQTFDARHPDRKPTEVAVGRL
jgi:predicted phosphodiesterase